MFGGVKWFNVYTCPPCAGNPLEEKHSAEQDWREQALKRVPQLKKLDGMYSSMYCGIIPANKDVPTTSAHMSIPLTSCRCARGQSDGRGG